MNRVAQRSFVSTGIAELDAAIEAFLAEPMGEWTTDDRPISVLADGAEAHGMCQMVSEQAAAFFKARGFDAWPCDTDMQEMGYHTTGKPQGEILNRDGDIVMGFYTNHSVMAVYAGKTETNIYGLPIYIDFTASQYGYTEHPKIAR